MKNLILSISVLLLSACYFDDDLNDYSRSQESGPLTMSEAYLWYYGGTKLSGVDSCQVVGWLENENDQEDFYSINRKCLVSGDTIYVTERNTAPGYNILNGRIYINEELFEVYEKLK